MLKDEEEGKKAVKRLIHMWMRLAQNQATASDRDSGNKPPKDQGSGNKASPDGTQNI